MSKELVSLIIPCYNEEQVLPILKEALLKVMDEMSDFNFELLFVNDGSKDQTLNILKAFHKEDARMNYLSFSRNFGKEAAIYAGLQNASGQYIALMDADMQDPPSLLPEMMNYLQNEDYDCVATRRSDRKGEPPIRSFFARCFYRLINKMSDANIVDGARDFRLMKRPMVDAILSMTEYNRFSKGIFAWVGYNTEFIPYTACERNAGTTKWNFWKLLNYAIEGIIGYSTAPLRLATVLGSVTGVSAILYLIWVILEKMIWGIDVPGYATIIALLLIFSCIQLFCIGIIGEYVGRTFEQSKDRPVYIAKDVLEY